MNLDGLNVYQVSMEIGERVWSIVKEWDYFAKDTVGKQFVRAADSIAANISEGYGRFHYKENKHFGYYGRGSLYETKTWLTKAHSRGLVENAEYESLRRTIESVAVRLNNYIQSIGPASSTVREDSPEYGFTSEFFSDGQAELPMTNDSFPNNAPRAPMTKDPSQSEG